MGAEATLATWRAAWRRTRRAAAAAHPRLSMPDPAPGRRGRAGGQGSPRGPACLGTITSRLHVPERPLAPVSQAVAAATGPGIVPSPASASPARVASPILSAPVRNRDGRRVRGGGRDILRSGTGGGRGGEETVGRATRVRRGRPPERPRRPTPTGGIRILRRVLLRRRRSLLLRPQSPPGRVAYGGVPLHRRTDQAHRGPQADPGRGGISRRPCASRDPPRRLRPQPPRARAHPVHRPEPGAVPPPGRRGLCGGRPPGHPEAAARDPGGRDAGGMAPPPGLRDGALRGRARGRRRGRGPLQRARRRGARGGRLRSSPRRGGPGEGRGGASLRARRARHERRLHAHGGAGRRGRGLPAGRRGGHPAHGQPPGGPGLHGAPRDAGPVRRQHRPGNPHGVDVHPGGARHPGRPEPGARPAGPADPGRHPRRGGRVWQQAEHLPRGRRRGPPGAPAAPPGQVGGDAPGEPPHDHPRPEPGHRAGGGRGPRGPRARPEVADLGAALLYTTAIVPTLTPLMIQGPYDIPALRCELVALYTNTCPTGAYRGAGRPEATYYLERMMDLVADATGVDPAEVRRRNFIPPDRFPYKAASGAEYDSGEYAKALDEALRLADYPRLRREQDAARKEGRLLGVGLSSYVEICGFGPWELGTVRVNKDASATIVTGTSPHGQGDDTGFAQIVAELLTIPLDRITVVHGDTLLVQYGGGTSGSRSMALGGSAVYVAAQQVREQILGIAATMLEASKADLVLEDGRVAVRGAPGRAVTLAEVAAAAYDGEHLPEGQDPGLEATCRFTSQGTTFPFGTHVCVVEVDPETGSVRVVRYVAVDDCGRVINPLLVDGQVHGGIVQGASQALLESVVYDENGQLLTGTLAEYGIPTAHFMPRMERGVSVTPTPRNPLGAKGIGEAATIGSTPAVVNAVVDALSHLGVRHIDMPLTPERVLAALRRAQAASPAGSGQGG